MNRKAIIALLALALAMVLALSSAWAADQRYTKGLKLYNSGKYEEAITVLKDYIKNTPDPKGYYLIGYSLYKLGRHDEADEYFKQSYLVQPEYTPTPTLEKDGKKLQHVRPEGYYEGKIEQGPAASGPEVKPVVPEGYMAVEQPSTFAMPSAPAAENAPAATSAPAVGNTPAVTNAPAAAANAPAAADTAAPARPERAAPRTPAPPPSAKAAGLAALLAGGMFLIIFLALTVGMYLFTSFCLFRIAKKLEVSPAWLAFIPIAQLVTVVKCADKPAWWVVLLLVPVVNIFIGVYISMLIAINLGKGKLYGIAMALVPVVNIVLLAMLAFSGGGPSKPKGGGKPGKGKKGEESTGEFMADEGDFELPDVPNDLDFDADEFK